MNPKKGLKKALRMVQQCKPSDLSLFLNINEKLLVSEQSPGLKREDINTAERRVWWKNCCKFTELLDQD